MDDESESQLCRGFCLHIQHALLPLTEVRRILRASPTAAGPCSRDAWFLVILCFISLLKCVLARLFLDVNFQILDTDAVTFGAQNLLFGRLGAQFDTLGDHGAIQEQLGGHQRTPWGPDLDFY